MTSEPLRIAQGTSRAIEIADIVDAAGQPLTVTDWYVHAQARYDPTSPVLAEWSTSPTAGQGRATAIGRTVRLEIPHAMSSAWTWTTAELHVEISDPITERRERLLDAVVILDPEVNR